MDVVSCSEAARIAGVKRQRIHAMKKDKTCIYNFFALYDPANAIVGVDLDSRDWKLYMSKRQAKINKQSGLPSDENKADDKIDRLAVFVRAVLEVIEKQFDLSPDEMDDIKMKFSERYSEMLEGVEEE